MARRRRRGGMLPHDCAIAKWPDSRRRDVFLAVVHPKPPPKWLLLGTLSSGGPMAAIPSRAYAEWYWHRGIDPERIRERLDAGLRQLVIERDGCVCGLCGGDVDPNDVHIDHLVPVSHGGLDLLENLQVAHSKCNLSKGNRV